MAYKLEVDIVEPDDTIAISLTFWGETENDVQDRFREAVAAWPYLAEAQKQDRLIEELDEIDEEDLPVAEPEEEEEEQEEEEEEEELETKE